MVDASQNSIAQNIKAIQARITDAEKKYHRMPGSVQLLAVSKTRPIEDIRAAIAIGQQDFGENYLQDALPKITATSENAIKWHFIGPIQSNKTNKS